MHPCLLKDRKFGGGDDDDNGGGDDDDDDDDDADANADADADDDDDDAADDDDDGKQTIDTGANQAATKLKSTKNWSTPMKIKQQQQ